MRSRTTALLLMAALAACNDGTGPGFGAPASMDVVSGDLQTAMVGTELPQPLVVRVEDANGRPVRNEVVNFRVVAGNGQVFAGAARTNNQGEARERWTLGTVAGDTQRVEVRAVDPTTGEALVLGSFRAIGTPDAPAAISAVPPAQRTGMANRPLADSLAAKVTDRYGNGVPGVTVTWSAGASSGSVSPATSTTGPGGIAKAQWTLGPVVNLPQTAQAAAGALTAAFTAMASPVFNSIVYVSGNAQSGIAGTPLADSLAVRALQGMGGPPVPGVLVNWRVESGGGSVSPATSITGPDGVAKAQWTLGPDAGEQRISASAWTGPGSSVGQILTATGFPAGPPRATTDSVRRNGTTVRGWGTVHAEGKAGTSWFEVGAQPDLSDAQVVGSEAYGATGGVTRSVTLTPAEGETVYFRFAAQNAYGTTRGQILSYRATSSQTNFRARFDPVTLSVILEWDDVGEWRAKLYRQNPDGAWIDIHLRESGAPVYWVPGDQREASDVSFNVQATSAGPYRMERCPLAGGACTTFNAPAVTVVPLAAPTGLQATLVAGGVRLTWQDNASNELDYVIVRTSPEGTFQRRIIAERNATSYTDTEAPAGATYRYRVYARAVYPYIYGLSSDWENRLSAPAEVTITR